MASRLNHPSICTIYDVGVDPMFIAMELLEGESLQCASVWSDGCRVTHCRRDCARRGPRSRAQPRAHSPRHQAGQHFLTPHGPKLLDFGLAKAQAATRDTWADKSTRLADAVLTDSGATVGTTAYMSPEQLRGLGLDGRTDVFSLGLVLYEMATGRRAFAGATGAAVSGAILYEQPVPPRELRPDIPVPRRGDPQDARKRSRRSLPDSGGLARGPSAAETRGRVARCTASQIQRRQTCEQTRRIASSRRRATTGMAAAGPNRG